METFRFSGMGVRMVLCMILLSLVISVAGAGITDIAGFSRISDLTTQKAEARSLGILPPDGPVRVIVTLNDRASDSRIAEVQKQVGSFRTNRKGWDAVLPNSFAATVSRDQIRTLQRNSAVRSVHLDRNLSLLLETANFWSGATKARAAAPRGFGVTGDRDGNPYSYSKTDVVIAIVDTGIDPMHRDLNGTDNGGTSKVIGWYDAYAGSSAAVDYHGHGTHVASIAAGEGSASGRYRGVAPGAALVGVRVGSGSYISESDLIEGINWVVTNKNTYGIRIMSISIGSTGASDGTDPVNVAVNRAVDAGIVVTVAAGNNGPYKYTIGSPAAAAKVITVGAIDDPGYLLKTMPAESPGSRGTVGIPLPEGSGTITAGEMDVYENNGFYLAPFSSRGPTADNRNKPDVVAPGVMIAGALSEYNAPALHGGYTEMSGTSMAAPFAAGVAALMLDANYALTPAQVKTRIMETAEDYGMTGTDIDYGAGRIRAYRAVNDSITGLNSAAGDQWVPTHLRSAGMITDTWPYSRDFSLPVTSDDYPVACTLISYDWSGSYYGTMFDIDLTNPLGDHEAYSQGYGRQVNAITAPLNLGTYNVTMTDDIGAGRYALDCSYR